MIAALSVPQPQNLVNLLWAYTKLDQISAFPAFFTRLENQVFY